MTLKFTHWKKLKQNAFIALCFDFLQTRSTGPTLHPATVIPFPGSPFTSLLQKNPRREPAARNLGDGRDANNPRAQLSDWERLRVRDSFRGDDAAAWLLSWSWIHSDSQNLSLLSGRDISALFFSPRFLKSHFFQWFMRCVFGWFMPNLMYLHHNVSSKTLKVLLSFTLSGTRAWTMVSGGHSQR